MCLSSWGWVHNTLVCSPYTLGSHNVVAIPTAALVTRGGSKRSRITYCFEHSEEQLKLYCETCGELVCFQCIMKDGKHHDHEYALFKKAFEKYKEEITSSLEPMEKQVATAKKALAQIDAHYGELSNQRAATAESIHITFRLLQEVLDIRERELIGQLDQMIQEKLKNLTTQREQIETALTQLNTCLHSMRENLRTGNEGDILTADILTARTTTLMQVKELLLPNTSKSNIEVMGIIFSASNDLTLACQNHGRVFVPVSQDRPVKKCTDETNSEYVPGAKQKQLMPQKLLSISKLVEQVEQPCEKLTHILHEPFHPVGVALGRVGVVACTRDSLITPSRAVYLGLRACGGVTIDSDGNILLTNIGKNCISKYSISGTFIVSVGKKGNGQMQFHQPGDITFNTSNHKVYVVDTGNRRVQILNSDLTFSSTFGKKGDDEGQFISPCGIACDSTGKVYVVDFTNCIHIFTTEGIFLTEFELYRPTCIAIDAIGRLYITSSDSHCVSVLTSDGKFVTSFGELGEEPGQFDSPTGLAIDDNGVVYVCDTQNNRIQMFSNVTD